jgi:hypothetical protein
MIAIGLAGAVLDGHGAGSHFLAMLLAYWAGRIFGRL